MRLKSFCVLFMSSVLISPAFKRVNPSLGKENFFIPVKCPADLAPSFHDDRLRVCPPPSRTETLVTALDVLLFLTSIEGSATLFGLLLFGTMKSVGLPDVATAPKIDTEFYGTSQI